LTKADNGISSVSSSSSATASPFTLEELLLDEDDDDDDDDDGDGDIRRSLFTAEPRPALFGDYKTQSIITATEDNTDSRCALPFTLVYNLTVLTAMVYCCFMANNSVHMCHKPFLTATRKHSVKLRDKLFFVELRQQLGSDNIVKAV